MLSQVRCCTRRQAPALGRASVPVRVGVSRLVARTLLRFRFARSALALWLPYLSRRTPVRVCRSGACRPLPGARSRTTERQSIFILIAAFKPLDLPFDQWLNNEQLYLRFFKKGPQTAMCHKRSSIMEDRINTALSLCTRKLAEVIVDTNSNLTSVKDAKDHTTSYIYDDKGRVYRVISPDTGTTTYNYNDPSGAGNLVGKTDANGVTIAYKYDAANRLYEIDYPETTNPTLAASVITYTYGVPGNTCEKGVGRLCSMIDASGTTSYEYTPKGQVTKETKLIDSHTYVTQYSYDQNGNLKTMTYPSGKVITYSYTNDRAVSVLNGAANLATNITYKPFGGMSGLTYGNELAGSISYDEVRKNYRITGITAGSVLNLSYPTYDNNGNIQAINNTLDPTKSKSFTYDALDRLWTAATGTWNFAWTYDGVGNRQTENGNSYTYLTGSNKLNSANALSYGYDNNGNTIAEGTRVFTYNQNQRFIRVVDGAITKGEYTYNGNGQRVKKVAGEVTTIFHYNLNGQIIAESESSGNITAEYVYLYT
jgi:YD repeat-containing protein